MTVVLLCEERQLDKERRGYARAFARLGDVHCVPPAAGWRERAAALRPSVVISPDAEPWLPDGIERIDAPTAVFHIDTYAALDRRLLASQFYDYTFVFHPGFEERFRAAGVEGVRLLPHAAERELFDRPEGERTYEVGWVGRSGRAIYRRRDAVLDALQARFATNDVSRYYTPEEMAEIYRASKIVVNVSRDDHPGDANMRCFEALASGALLVTGVPTELAALGFEENVHFAGFGDAASAPDVVASWLARDDERRLVASRGRELTLREHTYDARAAAVLRETAGGARANARSWPAARAAAARLQYAVAYGDAPRSRAAFADLLHASPVGAAAASWRLAILAAKIVKRSVRR